jgi:putative transposase
MVANVTDGSLGDVLGRFKSYTSKELYKMIAGNTQESRRDWMLKAFDRAGKHNPLNEKYHSAKGGRQLPGCTLHPRGYRTKNRLHS